MVITMVITLGSKYGPFNEIGWNWKVDTCIETKECVWWCFGEQCRNSNRILCWKCVFFYANIVEIVVGSYVGNVFGGFFCKHCWNNGWILCWRPHLATCPLAVVIGPEEARGQISSFIPSQPLPRQTISSPHSYSATSWTTYLLNRTGFELFQ